MQTNVRLHNSNADAERMQKPIWSEKDSMTELMIGAMEQYIRPIDYRAR
jgi:hypothetical protein